MKLEKEFFYDEVRDGFYIPGIMKRAWGAELMILSKVDRICKKYDINYYAFGGTLIGAVRDKQFIPWDDDIDICMKREDFQRFCRENWNFISLDSIKTIRILSQLWRKKIWVFNLPCLENIKSTLM